METDCKLIASELLDFEEPLVTPLLAVWPLAIITLPPSNNISEIDCDTSVIFPFSLSIIKPIFGIGVIAT